MTVTAKVISASFLFASLSACANFDLARAGHDALKQADCEQSEPRGACNRDWSQDYLAWQAQRAAYLQSLEKEQAADVPEGWLQPVDSEDLPEL